MLTDIIAVELDRNRAAIAALAFRRRGKMTRYKASEILPGGRLAKLVVRSQRGDGRWEASVSFTPLERLPIRLHSRHC
jgi:hypothetical protein